MCEAGVNIEVEDRDRFLSEVGRVSNSRAHEDGEKKESFGKGEEKGYLGQTPPAQHHGWEFRQLGPLRWGAGSRFGFLA